MCRNIFPRFLRGSLGWFVYCLRDIPMKPLSAGQLEDRDLFFRCSGNYTVFTYLKIPRTTQRRGEYTHIYEHYPCNAFKSGTSAAPPAAGHTGNMKRANQISDSGSQRGFVVVLLWNERRSLNWLNVFFLVLKKTRYFVTTTSRHQETKHRDAT